MKLEILDEFLENPTILKVYRDLKSVFLQLKASFLSQHWNDDYAIE